MHFEKIETPRRWTTTAATRIFTRPRQTRQNTDAGRNQRPPALKEDCALTISAEQSPLVKLSTFTLTSDPEGPQAHERENVSFQVRADQTDYPPLPDYRDALRFT